MKFESKQLANVTTIQGIVDVVNQYMTDILSEFADPSIIEITGIKVDVKNGNVYVMYNDYTEEQTKLQNILSEAIVVKTDLETELSSSTPDNVKIALLQNKLGKLASDFDELKPILKITHEFYDVI
jgi:hypothetical protein